MSRPVERDERDTDYATQPAVNIDVPRLLSTALLRSTGPLSRARTFRRQHYTRCRNNAPPANTASHGSSGGRSDNSTNGSTTTLSIVRKRPSQRHYDDDKVVSQTSVLQPPNVAASTDCDESGRDEHSDAPHLPACYAACGRFIDGLALPPANSTQQTLPLSDTDNSRRHAIGPPLMLSFPLLVQSNMTLTTLSAPLVDCICAHPACQNALIATGTCCVQVGVELLRSVDQHLHVVLSWLRDGCLEDSRPSLNCNTGVAVKDQVMAFYLSSRFVQTQPSPAPHHYTLWATASEYEWSERLIQPTFRRQQTTYKLAKQQSADMNEVMRGYEGSVLNIVNRLALVLHADGFVNDAVWGVRRILPMSYFEVRSHITRSTRALPIVYETPRTRPIVR